MKRPKSSPNRDVRNQIIEAWKDIEIPPIEGLTHDFTNLAHYLHPPYKLVLENYGGRRFDKIDCYCDYMDYDPGSLGIALMNQLGFYYYLGGEMLCRLKELDRNCPPSIYQFEGLMIILSNGGDHTKNYLTAAQINAVYSFVKYINEAQFNNRVDFEDDIQRALIAWKRLVDSNLPASS